MVCFIFLFHLPMVENVMESPGIMRRYIETFLNLVCRVAVVYSKIAKVRGNFVEDKYYQKATEFQETSLKASHQCNVRMTRHYM